ncbi:occludin [Bacteroides sp. OttesenSCG-928-D19]|nr:occludin [Bacteroides sp. OttesenSCG-928-N06]MDL2305954.1 occludin [Bacteroides sp. OttesenSCG-928-D19]
MKRFAFIVSLLVFVSGGVYAQSEMPGDTISLSINNNHVQFGEYLIDMNLLKTPQLPQITQEYLLGPDVRKNYNALFQPDPRWTYSQGNLSRGFYSHPYGSYPGTGQLQMASYRLNSNMRLNLYGQYNADGWKVPNRSALPWERDNFMGGMELKINNNFGIRVDVRTTRNPYFY